MRTRFYIEKRKGEDGLLLMGDRPIFMTVSFHGKRALISSGKKIDVHWWDAEGQKVRAEYPDARVLNSWLENMRQTAIAAWQSISHMDNPDLASFREAYKQLKPQFSRGYFDVFFLFMEDGSLRWSKATYSKVRTIYKHLKEFEAEYSLELDFRQMDAKFLEKFKNFYKERGNSESTTLKAVNTIVWFLNWATKQRYNIFTDYKNFYKELKDDPVNSLSKEHEVFLEWEELLRIFNLSLEEPKQQRARDIFCFICFTGIRFSELQTLKKEHVFENRIIINRQSAKTRIVPLNNFAKQIVTKYENKYYRNNAALPVMSMVTLNKYTRMIARESGLGKKSDSITAGVGILTFIMNALNLDIPAEIIASYTGVSNDRRIKILKQEMAKREMEKFDRR